jgi:uncharacterized protein (DUF2147 family)
MNRWLVAGALALVVLSASAQSTPVGVWKTIDDDGKTEKSLVRISDSGGVLTGKIEKIFDAGKQDSKCDKCTDERKDKPVLGMTIIEDVKKIADEAYWGGGIILDPNNGKTYKVRLTLKDGGKALDVRGYIGAPLLGRTQTWLRVE